MKMTYKTILVPTDFSSESEAAFEPALEMAQLAGGRIVLVTIAQDAVNLRMAVLAHSAAVSPEIDEVARGLVETARKKLEDYATRFRAKGISVTVVSEEELSPARAILNVAEREKVDLIVMATHGHGGLRRLLLGSVTERVVREAHCSVLVARK